jgi:hypothetical protein
MKNAVVATGLSASIFARAAALGSTSCSSTSGPVSGPPGRETGFANLSTNLDLESEGDIVQKNDGRPNIRTRASSLVNTAALDALVNGIFCATTVTRLSTVRSSARAAGVLGSAIARCSCSVTSV